MARNDRHNESFSGRREQFDSAVVAICGAADLRDTPATELLLQRACTAIEDGYRRIVLDLTATHRADSRLVAVLIAVLRYGRRAGADIRVTVSAAVYDILALYHVEWLIELPEWQPSGEARPDGRTQLEAARRAGDNRVPAPDAGRTAAAA